MHRSLYEEYISKRNWKSYYGISINPRTLFGRNSQERCRMFIEKHFEKGGKGRVFDVDFRDRYNALGKHVHTVSLYLLGLEMETLFYESLKSKVAKICFNKSYWFLKWEYRYIWYLMCLSHDIANVIEDANRNMRDFGLSDFLNQNNIQHAPFSYLLDESEEANASISEELVKNYFLYRLKDKKYDHGIVAGYLLFDRLKKNFDQVTRGIELPHKIYGLMWRTEHIDIFAHISYAIIRHNMWMVPEGNTALAEKYSNEGLNELIIKDDTQKVSFERDPFLFMLGLLDSIEPVKRFEGQLPKDILENVSIACLDDGRRGIKISWTDELKKKKGFFRWLENIYDAENWMQVIVSPCCRTNENQCECDITF